MASPISNTDPHLNHDLTKPVDNQKTTLGQKIWHVASKILLVVANIAAFFLNPTLYVLSFGAGFAAGLFISDKMQVAVDKAIAIWKKHPLIVTSCVAVAGFLNIQVSLAAATALCAAHLGYTVSQLQTS